MYQFLYLLENIEPFLGYLAWQVRYAHRSSLILNSNMKIMKADFAEP